MNIDGAASATRPEALQWLAFATGCPLVAAEHIVKMMVHAPAPYSTEVGRGKRNVPLWLEWLVSAFLAIVIGDAKNAAAKVPLYGDAKLTGGRIEVRQTTYEWDRPDMNQLAYLLGPTRTVVNVVPQYVEVKDETFFDAVVGLVNLIAHDWNGETHREIYTGYKAEIDLGDNPSVKVSRSYIRDKNNVSYSHQFYHPRSSEDAPSSSFRAIKRTATFDGTHITLLAMLWAGRLREMDAMIERFEAALTEVAKPDPEPSPTDDCVDHTPKSASPANESAGSLPGEPALSGYQPHDDDRTDADTTRKDRQPTSPDPNARACVLSSGVETSSFRTREHDPTSHHFASF